MDMDIPAAAAANGGLQLLVDNCDQQQTEVLTSSLTSSEGHGEQQDQGDDGGTTSKSPLPPHHPSTLQHIEEEQQQKEQGEGGGNDQDQPPQDGAGGGTSSSLTSASDTSGGPTDYNNTTASSSNNETKNFYYSSNVHNLPNAKKMRRVAGPPSSLSCASSEASDSGSGGCQSPSPMLSPRDAPSSSMPSPSSSSLQQPPPPPPPRQAVFSPPTGLEKRFEEVLQLEDTATTEYKMGQRIKLNRTKQSASTTSGSSAASASAAAAVASGSSSSSSSGDGRSGNDKNNSADATAAADVDSSRMNVPRNQDKKGQGGEHQEGDDDDDDGDGDDGDHESSAGALVVPDITQEELEKLLYAKDMYEMSAAEREYVLQDIHGVADMTAQEIESGHDHNHQKHGGNVAKNGNNSGSAAASEFVALKRQQLQQALLQSPTHGTAAYSQAVQKNYGYVTSSEFQLPFLRSNQWDVDSAAKQIIDYFDIKLQLFGPELLCKPKITLGDLSKEDRKQLDTGFFQFLPVRDVAGRAIVCAFPPVGRQGPVTSLIRAFYYIIMSLIEDVETQRNGLILMGVNVGPKRRVDREIVFNVHKVRRALPIRTVAIHYCYDDMRMIPMMTLGMLAMGAAGRVRFRPHYGDWRKDISYQLSTFGVPNDAVPITEDGEVKVKTFRSWVKARKSQEDGKKRKQQSSEGTIVLPTRVDVLYGRGKPIQDHVGNLRYHALLEYYHSSYEDAKKFQKKQLANRIVSIVHEYGGRFLKQDSHGAGWVEVDETVACDKVSHAFRTRRTTATASINNKANISSTSAASSNTTNKRRNFTESDSAEAGKSSGVSSPDTFMHPSNNVNVVSGQGQFAQHIPSQQRLNHPPAVPNLTSSSDFGQGNQMADSMKTSEAYGQRNWNQPDTRTHDAITGMDYKGDDPFDDSDMNPVEIWDNTSFHPL
eukprot:CAMPEP_0113482538 /NCGR_PEP_ID=MMETSP0014_2-20120614/22971_1 /TAXON_ID=2857 /ORGANISM="Nitzschia sp." /LENGTH=934 /DNA_ID=CAMNT_0000376059 /DNA_START=347 /DNA_END=3151 /DNA_ORIENTATION=+ /assembly_acc=CAM_ASM_000159